MNQLDKIRQLLARDLDRMNSIIKDSLATPNHLMNEIVTGYLKTKGKQIRPVLVLLSAKFFDEVNDDVLYAGAALEMLHNASLIHDDVVDDTMLRRDNPTVNAVWGNHLAVLVGDFFVSNALAAGIRTGHLSIISALSALGQELSLGEVDQICNAREHHFDEQSYFSAIQKKTASLFMNCVRMGAEAVRTPEEDIRPMVEYARLLGLAFQIKDDVFDYFDDAAIGKPTGNDLREGKMTLPLLHALSVAPRKEADQMKDLIRRGNLTDEEIAVLISFAKNHDGIEYAFHTMRGLQAKADAIIAPYPDSQWKEAFRGLLDFIINRNR
ncbi:MAG: polyprenyl synthetase family protein [Muribaculum sp.]|nr:polyprenyl synthetase family protein [Muribaculum sp.]